MIINSLAHLPKLIFFTVYRRRTGKKLSPSPTWNSSKQFYYIYLDTDATIQPISLLSSPHASTHPLTPYVIRPGGRRLSGKSRPRVAPTPRHWVTIAGRWGANRAMCTGCWLRPDRYGFTRATSISLKITVTPYPTSYSPTMVRVGRKGFNPTKEMRHLQSGSYPGRLLRIT